MYTYDRKIIRKMPKRTHLWGATPATDDSFSATNESFFDRLDIFSNATNVKNTIHVLRRSSKWGRPRNWEAVHVLLAPKLLLWRHLFSERPPFAEMRVLAGFITCAGKIYIIASPKIQKTVYYSWRSNIEVEKK